MEVSPAWNSNQLILLDSYRPQSKDPAYEISKMLHKNKELLFDLLSQPMERKVEYEGYNWRITSSGEKDEMMQTANKINDALKSGHMVLVQAYVIERYDNHELEPLELRRRFCIRFYDNGESIEVPSEDKSFQSFLLKEVVPVIPFISSVCTKLGEIDLRQKNWRDDRLAEIAVNRKILRGLGIKFGYGLS